VYAVISDRSRQQTVRAGDEVLCDVIDGKAVGEEVVFDEVLLVGNEGQVRVGKPFVAGVRVVGEVLGPAAGEKVIHFQFKRRKNVKVKNGHRQKYTRVRIKAIEG
jgi:large subunit ribosomal protein L21